MYFYIYYISFILTLNANFQHLKLLLFYYFFLFQGKLLRIHYTWKDTNKPVGTLFVGTSPELELALYSTCYLGCPNQKCEFTLNNKPIYIQTYTFVGPNKKKLIGSAFPGV